MNAEIISIGTELLHGRIDDTNATYISRRLTAAGIEIKFRTTVGDTAEELRQALEISKKRSDLVICTGGLGPTSDDITIETAADCFGLKLELDEKTANKIRRFYELIGVPFNESALRQAMIPKGADIINNPVGTAPGINFKSGNTEFFFFPGVPREMTAMIDAAVSAILQKAEKQTIFSRSLKVFGMGESNVEKLLPKHMMKETNPALSFLPQRFEVELRLTAKGKDTEECKKIIAPAADKIYSTIGEYIYGEDGDSLESAALRHLKNTSKTVSFAESCTGGLLGARLTRVPGASDCFLGGVIAYSNEVKEKHLGISNELLRDFGAVSKQTAIAMAEGAVKKFGSDIGIGVTGNAGPTSGDERSDVGRFFVAIAWKNDEKPPFFVEKKVMRERNDVRLIAAMTALDLIRKNL